MPIIESPAIWCATRRDLLPVVPPESFSTGILEAVSCSTCGWSQYICRSLLPVGNLTQDPVRVRSMRPFHVGCGQCAYCCECCNNCGALTDETNRCDNESSPNLVCAACCSCIRCRECRSLRRGGEICSHCGICMSCCLCVICVNCSALIEGDAEDDFCESCNRCDRCCSCRPGGGVRWLAPPSETVFHAASALSERRINRSMRAAACEIEVAGSNLRTGAKNLTSVLRKWHGAIVHDGSLPSRGYEINTAPAAGDHLVAQLKEICEVLKYNQSYATSDCGLHVHVDTRDFTGFDLRRLAAIYYLVEAAIFALQPKSRATGSYANPCGSALLTSRLLKAHSSEGCVKYLVSAVYGLDPEDWREHVSQARNKYAESRYNALNLHSHWHRGSVEYRHGAGSVSYDYISQWALLCLRITEAAKKYSDALLMKKARLAWGLLPGFELQDIQSIDRADRSRSVALLKMIAGRKLYSFIDHRLASKHNYDAV